MFEDRLKMLRLARGLSQQETADALGMKVNTYRNYENNEREPNSTSLIKLGNYFGVTLDYLLDYHCENPQNDNDNQLSNDFNTDEILHIKKYRELDTHGKKIVDLVLDEEYERCTYVEEEDTITLPFSLLKASAGLGDYLFDENFEEIEVEDTTLANQADFVIEVDGDSMLPKFENGDKVFVKGQQNIDVGDIGIFIIDGCGYIKQVGNGELISLNSEYPNIELHDYNDVKCIGKVIGKVE